MTKHRVTALITCMTDAEQKYLRYSLDSVLAQTEPCKIIVMVETGNRWIDTVVGPDEPVRIVRQDLQRLGIIRNIGIREADTEFVAFLDADDYWDATKIERQLKVAEGENADLIGTDHILIREDGVRFAFGLARYIPMPSSWLVRRSAMLSRPFDETRGYEGALQPRHRRPPPAQVPVLLPGSTVVVVLRLFRQEKKGNSLPSGGQRAVAVASSRRQLRRQPDAAPPLLSLAFQLAADRTPERWCGRMTAKGVSVRIAGPQVVPGP